MQFPITWPTNSQNAPRMRVFKKLNIFKLLQSIFFACRNNFLQVLHSVLFGLRGDNNIIYIGQCNASVRQIPKYRIDVALKHAWRIGKSEVYFQKLILVSMCHKRRTFSARFSNWFVEKSVFQIDCAEYTCNLQTIQLILDKR